MKRNQNSLIHGEPPDEFFHELEKRIKIKFNNLNYLKEALTHRSYLNEHSNWPFCHNERLEFLGDAVLELILSDFLFKKYPDFEEGKLTALRANLANSFSLRETALKLGLHNYVLLSKGEAKNLTPKSFILADVLEAFIGAIYLDQGFNKAQEFVNQHILSKVDELLSKKTLKDPKSVFQEKSQEILGITPHYQVLESWGPDHEKHFKVGVFIGKEMIAFGEGKSKQDAEIEAAKLALKIKGWDEE